jgi:phosphoserine phosphatase RsbU/P
MGILKEWAMINLYILNGPEIGRSFELKEGESLLGRLPENDICIDDKTVSRRHLKIVVIEDRYFIMDLKSQNRTFYGGEYLVPGQEVEIVEGAPIAVGMTVIGLGEKCKDKIAPYMETATLIKRGSLNGGQFGDRRKRTWQKRGDLQSGVTAILQRDLPLNRMLEEVLSHIFHHLKRLDRGAFVLVEPESLEIKESICRLSKPGRGEKASYSEKAVKVVVKAGKPVVYSKSYVEDRDGVVDTLKVLKIESVICLPLIGGSGVIGAMYLDSLKRPDGFRKHDLLDLMDIAQRIAVTVESDRFAADIFEVARNLGDDDEA